MTLPKTLVFLDIDGTLLRPDYTPNSNGVQRLIKKLSPKGYIFLLNSNRSLKDLMPVARKFGIKGPIIAENGVLMKEGPKITVLVNAPNIRAVLAPALKKLAGRQVVCVKYIDTVRFSKEKKSTIKEEWLVNKFRQYTASIHVRSYGVRDVKAAQRLAKRLKQMLPQTYSVSVSPIFANVLVSPKSADKGNAITRLKNSHFRGSTIIMVGDDAADLPALKAVDVFYAVGNAEESVKRRATFVAKKSYTQGVEEILRYIDSR
jgi:HAD superfamily hydrolase (TIGR01484 family)